MVNVIEKKIETKRQRYEILRGQLENDRSSFMAHWRDLGDYILPRRPRFTVSDVNRGERRNLKIIDSTATLAARTLRSGMMAGITSPARPWFRLTTTDADLAKYGKVKVWLEHVTKRMSSVFLRSNLYNILPITYGDMGVFGTAAMGVEEEFDGKVAHFNSFPIGSYMLATNAVGKVDVFMRQMRMTVRQIVDKFGRRIDENGKKREDFENISEHVKSLWERSQYQAWIDTCHVIQPNDEYDPSMIDSKYKRFISCYYEAGTSSQTSSGYLRGPDEDKYLRESGYNYFPILCPRWEVTGEDSYATDCPGMTALGDIKGLQTMHKRKAQAVEKMVNPPMTGPGALRTGKPSILAGDITYLDVREGQQGFRPVHEVKPEVDKLMIDIQDNQRRISRAFYEDLFLMMASSDRREITAREIDERHEEKLLALGPVLEQLNQDLLDPMIDVVFDFMMEQGEIPPPPDELRQPGSNTLKVEYVSIMAQAQKLVGLAGIERFAGFVGNMVKTTGDMSMLVKINSDKLIDVYADGTGIDQEILRDEDEVAQLREQMAKAQQGQQLMDMIEKGAGAAKNLSEADLEKNSALKRLTDQSRAGALVQQ